MQSVYVFFSYILLISRKKILVSAELKECVVIYIFSELSLGKV